MAQGDWLLMYGAPTRRVSSNSLCRHEAETPGAARQPMATVSRKVAAAVRRERRQQRDRQDQPGRDNRRREALAQVKVA
jgi:hypothetical protein